MVALIVAGTMLACLAASSPRANAEPSACVDCERTILFIGNSYTMGSYSPVESYWPEGVTDLNKKSLGGVPALFMRFADQAGLHYRVSAEAEPGQSLRWHWRKRRSLIDRAWDEVVLQEVSVLDPRSAGDPHAMIVASGQFAELFAARNPDVEISLVATWARPDLVYSNASPWRGKSIEAMSADLQRAHEKAAAASAAIRRVLPVGRAFDCAVAAGIATRNPFGRRRPGEVNLWAQDNHHASTYGYYLEALVVFAGITGVDPRHLGANERAARDLGIAPTIASGLQQAAWQARQAHECGAASRSSATQTTEERAF